MKKNHTRSDNAGRANSLVKHILTRFRQTEQVLSPWVQRALSGSSGAAPSKATRPVMSLTTPEALATIGRIQTAPRRTAVWQPDQVTLSPDTIHRFADQVARRFEWRPIAVPHRPELPELSPAQPPEVLPLSGGATLGEPGGSPASVPPTAPRSPKRPDWVKFDDPQPSATPHFSQKQETRRPSWLPARRDRPGSGKPSTEIALQRQVAPGQPAPVKPSPKNLRLFSSVEYVSDMGKSPVQPKDLPAEPADAPAGPDRPESAASKSGARSKPDRPQKPEAEMPSSASSPTRPVEPVGQTEEGRPGSPSGPQEAAHSGEPESARSIQRQPETAEPGQKDDPAVGETREAGAAGPPPASQEAGPPEPGKPLLPLSPTESSTSAESPTAEPAPAARGTPDRALPLQPQRVAPEPASQSDPPSVSTGDAPSVQRPGQRSGLAEHSQRQAPGSSGPPPADTAGETLPPEPESLAGPPDSDRQAELGQSLLRRARSRQQGLLSPGHRTTIQPMDDSPLPPQPAQTAPGPFKEDEPASFSKPDDPSAVPDAPPPVQRRPLSGQVQPPARPDAGDAEPAVDRTPARELESTSGRPGEVSGPERARVEPSPAPVVSPNLLGGPIQRTLVKTRPLAQMTVLPQPKEVVPGHRATGQTRSEERPGLDQQDQAPSTGTRGDQPSPVLFRKPQLPASPGVPDSDESQANPVEIPDRIADWLATQEDRERYPLVSPPSSPPLASQVAAEAGAIGSAAESALPRLLAEKEDAPEKETQPDLGRLAQQIYPLIKRMLAVERERRPGYTDFSLH